MTKALFIALSPNTESDDLRLAMRLIFNPSFAQNAEEKLASFVQHFFPTRFVFPVVSGRTALFAILSSLDLQKGDEVLLQAYTCVAAVDPILWVGAKPVFVDIDEESLNMSVEDCKKKISPRCKVLIVQHTFGLSAPLAELIALARERGLFVIEDCAHAFGGTYQGRKLGTFGDASLFSFGRDKMISSVFGGLIALNDEALAKRIKIFVSRLKKPPSGWTNKQLLHPLFFHLCKSTYTFFSFGKILMKFANVFRLFSKSVYAEEKCGGQPPFLLYSYPDALAALALHQIKKIDRIISHRRNIVALYRKHLASHFQSQQHSDEHVYLRYTILTPQAHTLRQRAKTSHIFLGDWFATALAPEGVDYAKIGYDPAACPHAEAVAAQSLNLPTSAEIGVPDALRIIHFLQKK